ncbi:unnamed protein product [Effrenium voratum]|nr:unnamed protein product [Effrenium voratum]
MDLPPKGSLKELSHPRLLLCLEYVEDPGLMGTLLRTALAFQWQAVFFLKYCADPFDSRCIRASQGALFDMPYYKGDLEDLQKLCRQKRLTLAVPHPEGTDLRHYEPSQGLALLVREEYATPWAAPRDALKIKVPNPLELHPKETFEMRALDTAVQGGILMHHLKHHHYPQVSRTAAIAS